MLQFSSCNIQERLHVAYLLLQYTTVEQNTSPKLCLEYLPLSKLTLAVILDSADCKSPFTYVLNPLPYLFYFKISSKCARQNK